MPRNRAARNALGHEVTARRSQARFEEERDSAARRVEELKRQALRLPPLMRSGRLPLIYAQDARDRAEETVADMSDLFDRALEARAEVCQAIEGHTDDLTTSRKLAQSPDWEAEIRQAMTSALKVLEDTLEAAEASPGRKVAHAARRHPASTQGLRR